MTDMRLKKIGHSLVPSLPGGMATLLPATLLLSGCGAQQGKESLRPNILICMLDDASFDHMSAYGCSYVNTPAFDRVAKEGLLFMNAYTPNALSAPSRACIITGRNPWQLEAASSQFSFFPSQYKTFPEALRENGYVTGLTGKGWVPGDPGEKDGKPRLLIGESWDSIKIKPPASGISRIDYASNFARFLSNVPEGKPWFFWCGSHEPHRKYEYGSGIEKGGKDPESVNDIPFFLPDSLITRTDILDYIFEIEYADSHFMACLNLLEAKGQLDHTLVIITSDNGMPFPRIKANAYQNSLHMPMAIMWKKGISNPGRKVNNLVSFIDLAPTFLEMAGIPFSDSGMEPFPGKSLRRIFRDEPPAAESPDYLLVGQERQGNSRPENTGYPIRGLLSHDYLYLKNLKPGRWPVGNPETGYMNCDASPVKSLVLDLYRQGKERKYWDMAFGKRDSEELYRISTDPECMINLAEDPLFAEVKDSLNLILMNDLQEQADPRVLGNGDVFETYPFSLDLLNNFYEKYMDGTYKKGKVGWVSISDYEDPGFHFGYRATEKQKNPEK